MDETVQTSNEVTSLNEILHLIKSVEKNTTYNIFIPSLKKEIPFKQFNTEQLKRLLKTVVDSQLYNTDLILTFNEIIKETCLEEESLKSLTILDKIFIFLTARAENISNNYEIQLSDTEIEEYSLDSSTYNLELFDLIKKYKSKIQHLPSKTFTLNEITIVCEIPSLDVENKFEKDLHKNIDIKINTQKDLQELIGSTFISEITKYISKLSINNTNIDLLNLSFPERIKVIEQLPTPLINNVILYIENYKKIVNDLLFVDINIKDINGVNVSFKKEIPYNASFFNN
jgi:hypothetical protein